MPNPVYVSRTTIRRWGGPVRSALLPGDQEPTTFGVHGAIARHYGLDSMEGFEPHATTIDHVIAAAGG